MFGGRDQAVFYSSVATDTILISARMEKAQIKRFGIILGEGGQIDLTFVYLRVIVIGVVTT